MESYPLTLPAATGPTPFALGMLGPGAVVRRATAIFQPPGTWPTTLTLKLQQWRAGAQVGSDLATLTVATPGAGWVPYEFVLPSLVDQYQLFQENDTLMLVMTQTGPQAVWGLLSWT